MPPIQLPDVEHTVQNHRAPFAEFIGTFALVLLGLGLGAQLSLHHPTIDGYFVAWIGWGLAVTVGVYISGGISGGHLNPAITIAMASNGRMAWRKVPAYLLAQFLGAFTAALVLYVYYHTEIVHIDRDHTDKTMGIFVTMPGKDHGNILDMFGEILASFMFILAVFAITTDANNAKPVGGLAAIAIGISLTVAGAALSTPTGYALNPARDLGPRFFTLFLYGFRVFYMDYLYFLDPLLGPVIGGVLAGWVHKHLCQY